MSGSMHQRLMISAALLAAVAAGCKGKGDKAKAGDPPAAPGSGSAQPAATPDAATAAAATPDAAAAPAAGAVTITAGKEPPRGCFGWAAQQFAAACVTGSITNGQPELQVAFVGGTGEAVPVATTVDEAAAAKLNAALATYGYAAPTGTVTPLELGKPLTLGAATLTLDSKTTKPGGDNVAPTAAIKLTAVCGDKDLELYRQELEGATPTVTVRALDDRLLIEVSIKVAREGEQSEQLGVAVLNPATCVAATENL